MWSRLRPYFKGFPAQEKVAQLMVMYGLRVHEGSVYAAGIKISDTSLARAASVDRRVVTATVDTIAKNPELGNFFDRLQPACHLRDVAPLMNWGAIEIVPTNASKPGILAGPMGWRGLLRVVDFQTVLTSQPAVAAALDKAQRAGGTKSPEAKALREGYQLVAKVLWTRRASIPRVHDLAWLDHAVVSAGTRLGRVWESEEGRAPFVAADKGLGDDVFRELFPKDGAERIGIPVQAFAGISPTGKLERGVCGPYRVGIVPEPRLRSLYDWAAKTKFNAPPAAISVLGEVEAFSAAARRGAGPSVAVVFAGYSFEDVAAE